MQCARSPIVSLGNLLYRGYMQQGLTNARRSVMFAPGDDHGKLQKAAQSAADSVIFELEDGVAFERKAEARRMVADALRSLDCGKRERIVRVNAFGSPYYSEDVLAVLRAQPDTVMLPKVEQAEALADLATRLSACELEHGWPAGSIGVIAMIETPLGCMNLREIATATPRLQALVFGAEDYAAAAGAMRTHSGHEVVLARQLVVMAAAAYGIQALDQVFVDINDPVGLAAECQTARELGYSGKMVIHPKQLEVVNQAFSPTAAEIAHAQRVMAAFAEATARGAGAFTLDGRMVDAPVIRQAERILKFVG